MLETVSMDKEPFDLYTRFSKGWHRFGKPVLLQNLGRFSSRTKSEASGRMVALTFCQNEE